MKHFNWTVGILFTLGTVASTLAQDVSNQNAAKAFPVEIASERPQSLLLNGDSPALNFTDVSDIERKPIDVNSTDEEGDKPESTRLVSLPNVTIRKNDNALFIFQSITAPTDQKSQKQNNELTEYRFQQISKLLESAVGNK